RRAVLDELHGGEQPFSSPDVTRVWIIAKRRLETFGEAIAHLRRVLREPLAFENLDVLQRDRAAGWMPRVGVRVHPAIVVLDRIHDVLDRAGDHDPAERYISRRHAFREGQ